MREHLIEFIKRIESRGGMASKEEIFCELIDLHCHYFGPYKVDRLPPMMQLEMMWKDLVSIKENIFTYRMCRICSSRPCYITPKGKKYSMCQQCVNAHQMEMKRKNDANPDRTICPRCKELPKEPQPNKFLEDGVTPMLRSYCKPCSQIRSRERSAYYKEKKLFG